jgi:hypothetical protein
VDAGEPPAGVGGNAEAGVVVEDVQDLYLRPVAESPMGDVGLPAFIRLVGAEPLPRRSGSFLWLRDDEPAPAQDPPDRGDRRHRVNPGGHQVRGDGLRTRVQPPP